MSQNRKTFLKCTAVPTLFGVPNKPKLATVRGVNPLGQKRTAAVIISQLLPPSSIDVIVSTVNVPCNHMYCKLEPTVGQSTSRFGADHTYVCRDSLQSNGKLYIILNCTVHKLPSVVQICC